MNYVFDLGISWPKLSLARCAVQCDSHTNQSSCAAFYMDSNSTTCHCGTLMPQLLEPAVTTNTTKLFLLNTLCNLIGEGFQPGEYK